MPPTIEQYGIDRLSTDDRLALAQQIRDSVAAELERQPLTDAQREELDRRIAAADANPNEGVPWEVIRAEAKLRSQRQPADVSRRV